MDEADRILNMDFEVEVDKILGCLPKEGRRNMLFSATMTKKVAKLQRASLSGLITNYVFYSAIYLFTTKDHCMKFVILQTLNQGLL